MRFLALFITLLLPIFASAAAIKAIAACHVKTNGLRYRTCASTSCSAKGSYNYGKLLYIADYVQGASINGNRRWFHLTNGYYVSSVYCEITDVDDGSSADPF